MTFHLDAAERTARMPTGSWIPRLEVGSWLPQRCCTRASQSPFSVRTTTVRTTHSDSIARISTVKWSSEISRSTTGGEPIPPQLRASSQELTTEFVRTEPKDLTSSALPATAQSVDLAIVRWMPRYSKTSTCGANNTYS